VSHASARRARYAGSLKARRASALPAARRCPEHQPRRALSATTHRVPVRQARARAAPYTAKPAPPTKVSSPARGAPPRPRRAAQTSPAATKAAEPPTCARLCPRREPSRMRGGLAYLERFLGRTFQRARCGTAVYAALRPRSPQRQHVRSAQGTRRTRACVILRHAGRTP
jgi:hypothetical protein